MMDNIPFDFPHSKLLTKERNRLIAYRHKWSQGANKVCSNGIMNSISKEFIQKKYTIIQEDFPFINPFDMLILGRWCDNRRVTDYRYIDPYITIC